MTTESLFQAQLDAHPDDWQTRLVLSDYLQEHGDGRAAGYRALARQQKYPFESGVTGSTGHWVWWNKSAYDYDSSAFLPGDWFSMGVGPSSHSHARFPSRQSAEDAAALAFALLPPERQAELLKGC